MTLRARGRRDPPSGPAPTIALRDDVRTVPASAPRRGALPLLAASRRQAPAHALRALRAQRAARGLDTGCARARAGGGAGKRCAPSRLT